MQVVETSGTRTRISRLQGGGSPKLSYRPGGERAAAEAATPRKWRLELVTIQPVRAFGRRYHRIISSGARSHARDCARELVRTAGVELTSPEWRSGTLPLSHVRGLVGDQNRRAGLCSFSDHWLSPTDLWWAGMELNHHS
jgi:hypothetical protein